MSIKIKKTILISGCLLGQRVRYDGEYVQFADSKLLMQLHTKFTVIAICPELMA